jgi:hypothetical protein
MLHNHLAKVLAPLAAIVLALSLGATSAQETPGLELDADPSGNEPTVAGPVDTCVAVEAGDTFDVQLLVYNVVDLLAFDIYVEYDADLLEVTDRETALFLDSNAGSRLTDVSSGVPDSDGRYNIAGVDIADPERPDSGSGTLAEITFTAMAAGTAEIRIAEIDIDSDDVVDVGPLLRDVNVQTINDLDGDGFFDGEWSPIEARIGGACDGPGPSSTTGSNGTPGNGGNGGGEGDGGGIGVLALIGVAAGAVVLAGAIVIGRRYLLRRANRPAV